jgi:hypothetical protein
MERCLKRFDPPHNIITVLSQLMQVISLGLLVTMVYLLMLEHMSEGTTDSIICVAELLLTLI